MKDKIQLLARFFNRDTTTLELLDLNKYWGEQYIERETHSQDASEFANAKVIEKVLEIEPKNEDQSSIH